MAMEARAQAVGAPPQYYMFPQNAGLSAEDAQRAIDAGLPIDRILPDLHVGAYGAVEVAAALFANPPVPGFNSGAINCETNADSHDHLRALQEAADLIDWFTADPAVTGRLYARTASFCTSTSSQFDYWDQVSGGSLGLEAAVSQTNERNCRKCLAVVTQAHHFTASLHMTTTSFYAISLHPSSWPPCRASHSSCPT
jgi:hypothetical protein